MLNLIFISNSPKAQYLKTVLQPLLKVIIDVVPDFDHGLKDVFEKRPSTVCIQDQIAGVTGESVARHIQMLLGTGAPRFMLMHNGSSTVKQIKGLFDYVIDLNQPDEVLAKDFQDLLQGLLGEQWHKISVAPDSPAKTVAASGPEQPKADELLDELLLDFKTASLPPDASAVPSNGVNKKVSVHTPVDEMADLLLEQARQAGQNEPLAAEVRDGLAADGRAGESRLEKVLAATQGAALAAQVPDEHKCHVKPLQETPLRPLQSSVSPGAPSSASSGSKAVPQKNASSAGAGAKPVTAPQQKKVDKTVSPVTPSEFRISRDKRSSEEPIPEDLLLAFEKNYRSKNVFVKWLLLALLLVGVFSAGWYAVRQNPQLFTSLKQSVAPSAPAGVKKSTTLAKPVQIELNKSAVPTTPQPAAPLLPSFVPQAGHDSSYATNNPGWERYLGNNSEVRVYKNGNGTSIKAVQVLALKGKVLPDAFLKSVLKELTGSDDYSIISREEKSGVRMLRGTVAQKADIIIYQKESSIRAFVISLN